MQGSRPPSIHGQRYAVALVALAVLLVIAVKSARGPAALSRMAVTQQSDAAAASAPGTNPVAPDMGYSLAGQEADPYPDRAPEQVQWALRQGQPAMILFHSAMCRPCRMMDALVWMVRRDYEPTVLFIEVLIDDPANAEVIRWAKVGTIPASIFLNSTGEAKRIVGLMKQADLRQELAGLLAEAQTD